MDSFLDEIFCQVITLVPKGKVATYGQIAKLAGFPNHARYVGSLLKKEQAKNLPWFRIINSQGKLSFPEGSELYNKQKLLLEQEGIEFLNSRVSLKTFAWHD